MQACSGQLCTPGSKKPVDDQLTAVREQVEQAGAFGVERIGAHYRFLTAVHKIVSPPDVERREQQV
jgi:hypothetical protein